MINGALLGEEALLRLAEQRWVNIEPGLTEVELDTVEHRFGFRFADDHREFLAAGLPVGHRWPNLRDGQCAMARTSNCGNFWPGRSTGCCSMSTTTTFWHSDSGARPVGLADALMVDRTDARWRPQVTVPFWREFVE